jgi:hypothetical protein
MADHNDRDQGSDDLYDEAAPRSIFAATWFRAVLVLIVLGVIGAVAVPYILDAMNAPPTKTTTAKPSPAVPPPPVPAAVAQATPTPAPSPPATPAPAPSSPTTTPPVTPPTPEKPTGTAKEPMLAEPKSNAKEPVAVKPPSSAAATKQTAGTVAASKATAKTVKVAKATTSGSTSGQWYVQVGAFKDPATAKKVAAKLREDNYTVEESARGGAPAATVAKATTSTSPEAGAGDHYDVIISGQTPEELTKRLAAKGLTAEATPNGAVVKPSLPLRDAVALSKELAVDGSKVQVRRAGAAASRTSSTSAASTGGTETLHRVSVGGFADRATAVATLKELESKGYKPFLTRR